MSKRTNPSDRVADLGTTRIEVPSEPVIADGLQKFRRNYPIGDGDLTSDEFIDLIINLNTGQTIAEFTLIPNRKTKTPRSASDSGCSAILQFLVGLSEAHTEKWQLVTKHIQEEPGDQKPETSSPATDYETSRPMRQPQRRATKQEVRLIVRDYQAGMSTKKLAADYGYARSTIASILKRERIEIRTQKPTTDTQRMAMMRFRSEGMPLAAIAKKVGVSEKTVWNQVTWPK